jgi:hypothetical protein
MAEFIQLAHELLALFLFAFQIFAQSVKALLQRRQGRSIGGGLLE